MQIGPNGEKRPDEPISRAVMVAKISTGEIEDDLSGVECNDDLPCLEVRRNTAASKRRDAGCLEGSSSLDKESE